MTAAGVTRMRAAGRPQLPAHQPHPAPRAHALHGLVQPHRAAAGARAVARGLAAVRRPRPGARRSKPRFRSLHDCFIRELKDGARPVDADPAVLASPCDAIVGACGRVEDGQLFQAKGFPYALHDLLGDAGAGARVPRRHLRHAAPHLEHVPPLPRAARLPGRAGHLLLRRHLERQPDRAEARREAVLQERARAAAHAARRGRARRCCWCRWPRCWSPASACTSSTCCCTCATAGPNVIACDARFAKGEEMGWFQHGSTIIVFAPRGFELCRNVTEGSVIRMGEPLMRLPGP